MKQLFVIGVVVALVLLAVAGALVELAHGQRPTLLGRPAFSAA